MNYTYINEWHDSHITIPIIDVTGVGYEGAYKWTKADLLLFVIDNLQNDLNNIDIDGEPGALSDYATTYNRNPDANIVLYIKHATVDVAKDNKQPEELLCHIGIDYTVHFMVNLYFETQEEAVEWRLKW